MKRSLNKAFDHWKELILPLSFVFSSAVNIVLYYLGLAFRENPAREYGFMLFCIVFAVCSGLTLLYVLKRERFKWQTWVLLCGVLLFFGVYFAIGFISNGLDSLLFSYLQKFVVFSIPAFIAGVCVAKWGGINTFFPVLEKISFVVFPAAVIYFNQVIFDANPFNYGRDLGIIHYMSFAYTLMPFLLAHIVQFAENADFEGPLKGQEIRHPQAMRMAMIIINWVAIYSSGTRGTVVCVVIFCALLFMYKLIRRMEIKRTVIVIIVMLGLLLFNMVVYAPPGMRWLSRMDMFLEGLTEGKIVTAVGENGVEDNIDDIVLNGFNQQDSSAATATEPTQGTSTPDTSGGEAGREDTEITEPTQGTSTPDTSGEETGREDTEITEPTQETSTPDVATEETVQDDSVSPEQIRNRGTLYKIAFKEFLQSPVTGMGPGSYSEKYGKYPHNAILELLAETGLVGTLIIFVFVLVALKKFLVDGWRDNNVQTFLLFIMAYAVYANISGTVWDCRALLCALGFGIAYQPEKKLTRKK